MAGRDLPGHQDVDSRWLVDRQIYERRRDGVRYVTWSRGRQLRLVWLVGLLLMAAAGLGGASVWAWQRIAPGLIAAIPPAARSAATDRAGDGMPAATPDPRLHALEAARDAALRERDAALARLAEMTSPPRSAEAHSAPVPTPPAAGAAVTATEASAGGDLQLETTLLRHERDAARQQIDALMQLTAQLKAELAGRQSPLSAPVATAGVVDDRAAMQVELAGLRQARDEAVGERDRLQAGLRDAEAAARALQTNYDRLAGRVSDAEQALAARDLQVAETRKAVATAEDALAEVRRTAAAEAAAAQAAQHSLREQLDVQGAASRKLEAGKAAVEAERASLRAELERIAAERDQAMAAERAGREERDALASRLQSLDEGRQPAEAGLAAAERDQLLARAAELQASLDAAKATADESGRRLVQAQGELAGARQSADGLRQALDAARTELAGKEELLAAVPALQARLALAEAKVAETVPAPGAEATMVPMATWTVVEDGGDKVAAGTLREELATALLRIKELAGRVSESESRAAELERYLGSMAPPPPPMAPRQADGG